MRVEPPGWRVAAQPPPRGAPVGLPNLLPHTAPRAQHICPLQKMKSDLRQEINTQARLAAVEQANKGGGSVVVQQTVAQQQAPTYVAPVTYERYCGPISILIGVFLLP